MQDVYTQQMNTLTALSHPKRHINDVVWLKCEVVERCFKSSFLSVSTLLCRSSLCLSHITITLKSQSSEQNNYGVLKKKKQNLRV